ncbi:NmrA family NAD(P)-binding protein [Planotetraspora phitsanulokensis]|uniref:Nucleotide-diphosphate-sugar epimerase n=1 Tax=Planotetraspora phitsanulokensis TaxID=575192 RepID=A0A8J3UJ54_9ACTN|nr:SDR family oxidoreductase [Planotetraspora phitsanulokensis]GII39765.1 nucleotide-diphosphate-sugar epimerase [Planotetraspora phitsanulokensis]
MTILITGATGNVSGALLRSLPTTDDVRVLVRDPGKARDVAGAEVVVGDLDQPRTLGPAFEGVDTLWLLTAMGPQAPHASMNAVWAARRAGVRHIVRMSAVGAGHEAPTRNGRLHALSDAELMASGLGWTIIRPHFFMQNLLGSVNGDTLFGNLGEGRLGMIDVRDIADFAARVLTEPENHDGKVYTLTGPAVISLKEAAEQFGTVLGTPIRYHSLSEPEAYQAMLGAGLPDWIAAVNAEYGTAYAGGWGDFTTPDFPDVMGRPARSFADFARDFADRIRGA